MAKSKYIAVAGNIGCGKSTLVDFLCKHYGTEPFFEPNETNPYLVDFYKDMKAWAFHSQMYFLANKFRLHRELQNRRIRRPKPVVQDRTIYEDAEVFAAYHHRSRNISKRDWSLYQDMYRTIADTLEPPDVMIYLRASVRTIRKRIKLRGRPEEQGISAHYIRSLNKLYESWFKAYDRSPTVTIETDNLDYVTDVEHQVDLKAVLLKHIGR